MKGLLIGAALKLAFPTSPGMQPFMDSFGRLNPASKILALFPGA